MNEYITTKQLQKLNKVAIVNNDVNSLKTIFVLLN